MIVSSSSTCLNSLNLDPLAQTIWWMLVTSLPIIIKCWCDMISSLISLFMVCRHTEHVVCVVLWTLEHLWQHTKYRIPGATPTWRLHFMTCSMYWYRETTFVLLKVLVFRLELHILWCTPQNPCKQELWDKIDFYSRDGPFLWEKCFTSTLAWMQLELIDNAPVWSTIIHRRKRYPGYNGSKVPWVP